MFPSIIRIPPLLFLFGALITACFIWFQISEKTRGPQLLCPDPVILEHDNNWDKIGTQSDTSNALHSANVVDLNPPFEPRSIANKLDALMSFQLSPQPEQIVFYHLRKAGGSSLKRYLHEMGLAKCDRDFSNGNVRMGIKNNHTQILDWELHNLHPPPYRSVRGKSEPHCLLTHEVYTAFHTGRQDSRNIYYTLNANRQTKMQENGKRVYITAFREPVDRVLSQYNFEERWNCQTCDTHMTPEQQRKSKQSNLRSARLDIVRNESKQELADKHMTMYTQSVDNMLDNPNMFVYVNNYYIWTLLCSDKQCSNFNGTWNTEYHLELAKQVLRSFDIVLVTEWFDDYLLQHYVNLMLLNCYYDCLELKKSTIPTFVQRKGKVRIHRTETLSRIQKMNAMDIKLYEWVQEALFNKTRKLLDTQTGRLQTEVALIDLVD